LDIEIAAIVLGFFYTLVMRKNTPSIIFAILMSAAPGLLAGEVPSELMEGLTKYYRDLLCSDSSFAKCVGAQQKDCVEAVIDAVGNCDYSPVWEDIQRKGERKEYSGHSQEKGWQYGKCFNERIESKLKISERLYQKCFSSLIEKHRGAAMKSWLVE
ncbi:MAG: hypothetical protein KME34_13500, partial [Candidatus Thiodiazotropha sp. (ex Codakia orbicularis)]|nr:hypothetical protein [Candidatus Thiodiazotropha sp. (ex Codakia orbicularis)]